MADTSHQLLHSPEDIAAFQADLAKTLPMSAQERNNLQEIMNRIDRNVELLSDNTEHELMETLQS